MSIASRMTFAVAGIGLMFAAVMSCPANAEMADRQVAEEPATIPDVGAPPNAADVATAIAAGLPQGVTITTATPAQLDAVVRTLLSSAMTDEAYLEFVGALALAFDAIGRTDFGTPQMSAIAAEIRPGVATRLGQAIASARLNPSPYQTQVAATVVSGIVPAESEIVRGGYHGPGLAPYFGGAGGLAGTGFIEPQRQASPF